MSDKPVNAELLRLMEHSGREIAKSLAVALRQHNRHADDKWGFALFIFSFSGSEMTYISNANRQDMVKVLEEFIARNPPEKTWDEQHG